MGGCRVNVCRVNLRGGNPGRRAVARRPGRFPLADQLSAERRAERPNITAPPTMAMTPSATATADIGEPLSDATPAVSVLAASDPPSSGEYELLLVYGPPTDPSCGSATYGNESPNALSFSPTASPRSFGEPTSSPSTTCSAMSTTSSVSRRPFGKPALSPPITPRRLGCMLGWIEVLSLSSSEARTFGGWLRPLTPLRKTSTRSLRGSAGALIL